MLNIDKIIKKILHQNPDIVENVQVLHPSEIAQVLTATPNEEDRLKIWRDLSTETKAHVLTELGEDIRVGLLRQTDITELIETTTKYLSLDDLTDLLQDLPEHLKLVVLDSLDKQNREKVEKTLAYPEDTAGGLLDHDVIKIRPNVSLDTIHRYIRKLGVLPVATDKLMVVNRKDNFLGTLNVAEILTKDGDLKVSALMNKKPVTIPVDMPDHEVAQLFQSRDLVSAPVIDANNKFLGRITIDDIVDVIQEDAGQMVMSRDGLDEEDDIFTKPLVAASRRNIWLGVHLLAGFFSAYIIGNFEQSMQKIIALAVLMPIISAMSGVAGSQTLTLTIRGMSLNQISSANTKWLLIRESSVGILNGVLWGLVLAITAYFWFDSFGLSMVLLITLFFNLIAAAILGVTIPIIQDKLNIDPAVAGHVALTATTDALGFFSFLGLATIVLI